MAALMRPTTIFAGMILFCVGGCAQVKPAPSASAPQEGAAATPLPSPSPSPSPQAAVPVEQAVQAPPIPPKNTPPALVPPKAKPRIAASSAKPAAPAAPAIQPSKQTAIAQATPEAVPAAPTLDLAELEQKLRDTHAIGVLTKLSLKNQVDDLLNLFRSFYRGEAKTSLPELRQRYNLLLLKVLTLLQDGDAQLAAAISSSREAIWGILADPDKFAKI